MNLLIAGSATLAAACVLLIANVIILQDRLRYEKKVRKNYEEAYRQAVVDMQWYKQGMEECGEYVLEGMK